MAEEILISPLGRSPGAVSGVYFALREAGYHITRVISVGTTDELVTQTELYLEDLFSMAEVNVAYTADHIDEPELTRESAEKYLKLFGQKLEEAGKGGNTVHLAVTAGLAGMSALAVLASNFYGADHLWHFWVLDDIARGSAIDHPNIPAVPDPDNPFLNPTVPDHLYANNVLGKVYELAPMPFINLGPLIPILRDYVASEGKHYPETGTFWYKLATERGQDSLADVFTAEITMELADRIVQLSRRGYSNLPEDEQHEIDKELWAIFGEAGISDTQTRDRLHNLVKSGSSSDQLRQAISESAFNRLWAWWVRNHAPIKPIFDILRTALDIAKWTRG